MIGPLPRLNAYTIMETMVALVLTAVTVSLVYAAIRLLDGQEKQLVHSMNTFATQAKLHKALQEDVRKAEYITFSVDELSFVTNDATIRYSFLDLQCLRHERHLTDTFAIQTDSLTGWFLGAPIAGPDDYVDEAVLFITVHGKSYPVSITKRYDARMLIHLTTAKDE